MSAGARAHVVLIALLLGFAALAWWTTAIRMDGMDQGPGTELGSLGWFIGVWVVMMAAMMLPSAAPAITVYARMARAASPVSPLLFAAGYLMTWTMMGLVAFAVFDLGRAVGGDTLAWDRAGRWVAGATLLVAAAYELTPAKDACLRKCRHPIGSLATRWREGRVGALDMGARHGAWCVGCCWALMASLLALGVMSLAWMAFVAGLIALEKTLPWERVVTAGVAGVLVVLGIALSAGIV